MTPDRQRTVPVAGGCLQILLSDHGGVVRLMVAAVLLLTSVGCNIYGRPQRTAAHEATLAANCDGDPAKMPAKELA